MACVLEAPLRVSVLSEVTASSRHYVDPLFDLDPQKVLQGGGGLLALKPAAASAEEGRKTEEDGAKAVGKGNDKLATEREKLLTSLSRLPATDLK